MRFKAYHFGPYRWNEPIQNPKPFGDIRPDVQKVKVFEWPYLTDGSANLAYVRNVPLYTSLISTAYGPDFPSSPPELEFEPIVVDRKELEEGAPISRQALMQWYNTSRSAT